MAEVDVFWLNEHRFVGVDSSKHSVVFAPMNDIGVRPSDGLLLALASCSAYDIVNIVQKQRMELTRLHVHVEAEQASDPPWSYQRIHLTYTIIADGLQQNQAERAVDLSLNRYCSVRASLSPDIAVTFDVRIGE